MKIEEPEVVTVLLMGAEVKFTRDEFAEIEFAAALSGVTTERWIVDRALEASAPGSHKFASSRGAA